VVRAGAGRTLQQVGPLADVTVRGRPILPAPEVALALPRLPLPVRLAIEVPGPFRIDSRELDLRGRASLVLDARDGQLGLRGRVEALRGGHLELFDRRYDVEHAALVFGGAQPEIDIAVTREVGDVLLSIEVRGPIDDPTVSLVADPPIYDQSQIGGLVAAGDARAAATTGAIGHRMVGVITGIISSRLFDTLAPGLPLDVVKIEPGATAATPSRLEIGKFVLGDRVYVSYAYQFGGLTLPTRRPNTHQAQVQLKLVRRLSLDARYGDAGAGALDLTFTLRR
jgi:autotransporter translocation and assembly factor TamB